MQTPLINQEYLLEKFEGKGGWTYALIPQILQDKTQPFGWVKVRGSIDGYEIKNYNLMPFGKGKLFLAVKAEIRKKIKKQAGDSVHIILYPDNSTVDLPQELIDCLQTEPTAYEKFIAYSVGEQKAFIDWIYSAKKEDTKEERIIKTIEKVLKSESFYKK